MIRLLLRVLIALYPSAFRRRFGVDMAVAFADKYAAARRRGLRSAATCLAAGLADLFLGAVIVRAASVRDRLLWPEPAAQQNRRSDMWWDVLLADIKFAWRLFVRNPMFSVLATLALAFGIGANTAMFTLVDGVLLRPLPYAAPDRLAMIWSTNEREHRDRDAVAPLDFLDFRKAAAFSAVEAGYSFLFGTTWSTPGGAEPMVLTAVTPGTFEMLGRAPVLGRPFSARETDTAIVLSYPFWRNRLGGDPDVLGRVLTIDFRPRVVVGVMPRDFVFPYRAMLGPSGFSRAQDVDAWIPLALVPPAAFARQSGAAPLTRSVRILTVLARLRPGVTLEQARAEVQATARQLAAQFADTNAGVGADLVAAHEQAVGGTRAPLLVLLAGVGLVLLMACVNLTNMLLARSAARQRELAIRTALGAGRSRLVQQTLVEAVLLAAAGGALAVAVLKIAVAAVVALAPPELPRVSEVRPDAVAVLFACALSLVTGVFIGLVPALSVSRVDTRPGLKQSGRGAGARSFHRSARAALVVAEAALAVVLTIGAGLLLRSFVSLMAVDPGFRPAHLLTLQITVPPKYASPEQRRALYAELESGLLGIPGVTAVGGTTRLPLGSTNVSTKLVVEGRSAEPAEWPEAEFRRAIFDYFGAMGIPIIRGRAFTPADGPAAPPVCVVNDALARQLFPGEDPIGRHVKFGGTAGSWSTIVGVVGDVRHSALDARPMPEVYVYFLQNPPVNPFLVIRSTLDPREIVPAVRTRLLGVDPSLSSNDVRPMTAVVSDSVAQRRFVLLIAGAFGLLALVMAAAGVYGVMALLVAERRPEMAIRLALGADPSSVLALVLRQGLTLAAVGAALGLGVAAVLAPSIGSQLYGVRPSDPITFAGVPLLVLLVAAIACLVPARRTMRIDPAVALKAE